MRVFRLCLLATGLIVFLILRFLLSANPAPTGIDPLAPTIPKSEPAQSPKEEKPFPQNSKASAMVRLEWVEDITNGLG